MARKSASSHADVVESALRRAIITAEFEPGARLSAEALAIKFQVSPTPVREALSRLAGERLVTLKPQRGVRVADLSVAEMEEIYEIRALIEPLAVKRSVDAFDDESRARLRTHYDRMLEHAGPDIRDLNSERYAQYEESHMAFHEATLSQCGSSWLLSLSSVLSNHSLRYRFASLWLRERYDSIAEEHEEIFEASSVGDSARAMEAHSRHLNNTRDAIRELRADQLHQVSVDADALKALPRPMPSPSATVIKRRER